MILRTGFLKIYQYLELQKTSTKYTFISSIIFFASYLQVSKQRNFSLLSWKKNVLCLRSYWRRGGYNTLTNVKSKNTNICVLSFLLMITMKVGQEAQCTINPPLMHEIQQSNFPCNFSCFVFCTPLKKNCSKNMLYYSIVEWLATMRLQQVLQVKNNN